MVIPCADVDHAAQVISHESKAGALGPLRDGNDLLDLVCVVLLGSGGGFPATTSFALRLLNPFLALPVGLGKHLRHRQAPQL